MLVGIISDSHDNLTNLGKAIELLNERKVDLVLHCGDFISPFVMKRLWELKAKLIGVFGNNDGDKALLSELAYKKGFELHNQPYSMKIGDRKLLLMHGWGSKEETLTLINSLAEVGHYDIIIYGHTHEAFNKVIGRTLVVNPGEVYGYLTGKASLAILNVEKLEAEIIEL